MTDAELSEQAFEWIKTHHKQLIDEFANKDEHISDISPTTLFMAESPGAGKTEVSKRLLTHSRSRDP